MARIVTSDTPGRTDSVNQRSTDDLVKELIRCTICFDRFISPRMLPCLHSFCEKCLDHHIKATSSERRSAWFTCPQCREVITLPLEGARGFRADFRATQVQDILHLNKIEATSTKRQICDYCKTASKTTQYKLTYCTECAKHLCTGCVQKHKEIGIFSGHQLVSTIPAGCSRCKVHRNDYAAYLCLSCKEEVCSVCVMHSHNKHNVKQLQEGLAECRDILVAAHADLESNLDRLKTLLKKVTSVRSCLENSREETDLIVAKHYKEALEKLKKSETFLKREINDHYDKEMKKCKGMEDGLEQQLSDMSILKDLSGDVLQASPKIPLLSIYRDVTDRITNIVGENKAIGEHLKEVSIITFEPSKSRFRLGKMKNVTKDSESLEEIPKKTAEKIKPRRRTQSLHVYSEKNLKFSSQALCQFGREGRGGGEFQAPRDVCFLPDGTIVVADCNNERLQRFHQNGMLISVIADGKVKPWGITTTKDGNIAVTDNLSKAIKVFTPEGQEIAKYGDFLCPCGVASDPDGLLAVTDFFSTCVYILDANGNPIREFHFRTQREQHTCGVSRLAILPNSNIIISDVSNRVIKLFTTQGTFLCSVLTGSDVICPQGICRGPEGVACVADAVLQNILMIDPENGRVLGQLLQQRADDITGMALSETGLVAITQMKNHHVKIFKLCQETS